MPETPYMDVDFRRDHSLRVPRPDLSVDLGTPNACTGCHLEEQHVDKSKHKSLPHYLAWMSVARAGDREVKAEIQRVDKWAADLFEQWYPGKYATKVHFAYTLSLARDQEPKVREDLYDLARLKKNPAIVRASALAQLVQIDAATAIKLSGRLLDDNDAQVRITAVINMDAAPLAVRLKKVTPLLNDPVRAVRVEAARVLADAGPDAFNAENRKRRDDGLAEYRRGLLENSDLAQSHMGLGLLAERQRDFKAVVESYRNAIRVQPAVTGPRTNLAAFYDRLSEEISGIPQQQSAKQEASRLRGEELPLLKRDAGLAPESAVIQYRYGLAAYLAGNLEDSRLALEKACKLEPKTEQFRLGLTLLLEKIPDKGAAMTSAKRLVQISPTNTEYRKIEMRIQAQWKP